MTSLRRVVLVVVLVWAQGAAAAEFVEMVRALNTQQNRSVMGDPQAAAAAARQLAAIDLAMPSFDPQIWKEDTAARAAAIYLLCGGAPGKLRELYDAKLFSEELGPLIAASLRYAEGESPVGPESIIGFDARRYPPTLGGHLALVQGGTFLDSDTPRAISLLDVARLLMPASLVEEAALRREVAVVDPVLEPEKFVKLSERYLRNYRASPFAASFWSAFQRALSVVANQQSVAELVAFEKVIDLADPARRAPFYLSMARKALMEGRTEVVAGKLDKAESAATSAAEKSRVATYRMLLRAVTSADAEPLKALAGADAKLPREDEEAARIVETVLTRQAAPSAAPASDKSVAQQSPEPELLIAARRALQETEPMLNRELHP